MRLLLIVLTSCVLAACADSPSVPEPYRPRIETIAEPRISQIEYQTLGEYAIAIRRKIRGNVVCPPGEFSSTTEAVVSLVLGESGDIDEIKIIKSSGYRSVDEAVMKALKRSSPLPVFNRRSSSRDDRALHIVFRPFEHPTQQEISSGL